MKWISEQLRIGIGITTNEIINKSIELDPKQKDKSPSDLEHWYLAFLRSYSFSLRISTHIGQRLRECANTDYKEFMNYVYTLRTKYENDNIYPDIYNMEETPIYLELISNKTVAPKGAKTVYINTHGGEKIRITVILCISANGIKLPPLL